MKPTTINTVLKPTTIEAIEDLETGACQIVDPDSTPVRPVALTEQREMAPEQNRSLGSLVARCEIMVFQEKEAPSALKRRN